MNKRFFMLNAFIALIGAVFSYGNSFAEPPNLELLRQEVIAYHDSGEYQKEIGQVIARADNYVVKKAVTNAHSAHPLKLALVLDIDETSLSNYKQMRARGFSGELKRIHQGILLANDPAIASTLKLYQDAKKYKVSVFFITGRKESERQATCANLQHVGYRGWTGIYFKPKHYQAHSAAVFKTEARAAITKQGYTIIASIGDQQSDLTGGYALKTFKLPNPYYYIR